MNEDTEHPAGSNVLGRKGPEMDRLPPPAFPPGTRRGRPVHRKWKEGEETSLGSAFPEGAFISPDEPIRRIGENLPEDALISPDDPIQPRRARESAEEVATKEQEEDREGEAYEDDVEFDYEEDVEVTGIGSWDRNEAFVGPTPAHPGPYEPHELAELLQSLAGRLKNQGGRALLSEPGLSSFESALRGFLTGYLVGSGD